MLNSQNMIQAWAEIEAGRKSYSFPFDSIKQTNGKFSIAQFNFEPKICMKKRKFIFQEIFL